MPPISSTLATTPGSTQFAGTSDSITEGSINKYAKLRVTEDWNTALIPGFWQSTGAAANAPSSSPFITGLVTAFKGTSGEEVILQEVTCWETSGTYVKKERKYRAGVGFSSWGAVSGGSGSSSYSFSFFSSNKAVGTVPFLLGSALLVAGTYAPPVALLGAGDPLQTATLKIQLPTGTVLATVGGVSGGLALRSASEGFTLTELTLVEFALQCSAANQPAFLHGLYLLTV